MQLDRVAEALEKFVNAEDYDESRRVVEQNPELLSDEAQDLLNESIEDYRDAGRDQIAGYLEEHRRLLQRSREVGIPQAFQEASQQAEQALKARQSQLASLKPEKPTGVQAAVWQLIEAESAQEVERILNDTPELAQDESALVYLDELIRRAREAGYNEALRFLSEYHELLRALYELPPALRALREFIAAPTWEESGEILKRNPELMGPEGIRALDMVIERAQAEGDQESVETLQTYRAVIERSREVGPDQAIKEILEPEEA